MTKASLHVDVVVVTFNSASTIVNCLESIKLITADYRLIVVDNGSTDSTLDTVASLAPEAHLLTGHGNIGFGAAVNLGARNGTGSVIMVLNPDAYLERGVNAVIDVAVKRTAVATGYMRGEDGALRSNVFRFPRVASVLRVAKASVLPEVVAKKMDETGLEAIAVDYIEGSLMVIPRSIWNVINGFSSSYYMYGEDRDLSYRALMEGFETVIVDTIAFTHIGGFSAKRQNWYAQGILVFFLENRRVTAPVIAILLASKFLLKSAIASIRNDREEVKASWGALKAVLATSLSGNAKLT